MVHVVHALMIQWAHNLLGLWLCEDARPRWPFTCYLIVVGRSPYRWEAPEECSLIETLYIWECVRSTGKERVRRELEMLKRWLHKRALLSCRRQVGQFRSRGAGKLRQAKGRSVDDLSTVLAYVSRSYRWLNLRSVRPTRVSRYSVSSTVGE